MAIKNRGTASQSVNIPLALRFAAIVIQIFITAIFLLCEISLHDDQLVVIFDLHPYWTSVTPLIFFFTFGTQRDLMVIWKYWAYRLAGKQPRYTPRSSNEGQTLSNSSAPATINTNDPHFIKKLGEGARGNGKVHRASSSAGGRTSGSIMDLYGPLGAKHSTDPSDLNGRIDRDIEAATPKTVPDREHPALTLGLPELSHAPDGLKASSPTMSSSQAHFYSSPSVLSSQALVSSQGHSGTHGLMTAQSNLPRSEPPFIIVTDGFGAVFGAQVPPNMHSGIMGRQIMSREERERRLALDEQQRRPRAEFGRERRQSVGLPPPPRSPRQSNARPSSAGGAAALEPNQRGGAGLGSGISPPWNWDSPFRLGPSASAQGVRDRESSDCTSRDDSDPGIEMEEKVRTPSGGSFERGHVRHESREESLRTSWVSKDPRASVASDRTFG
ncbi:Rad60-SLD domain protein [Rhizoctonia solani 123E]|uniref:Rad60-SLD domain protein n=1 Tax=Rhizoctonia solani 123E TaxID=1423351 RepID=A0A074RYK4_9AGAM|nr:Rad60-SLD domain protein [Rhizoctonia solani 123E]